MNFNWIFYKGEQWFKIKWNIASILKYTYAKTCCVIRWSLLLFFWYIIYYLKVLFIIYITWCSSHRASYHIILISICTPSQHWKVCTRFYYESIVEVSTTKLLDIGERQGTSEFYVYLQSRIAFSCPSLLKRRVSAQYLRWLREVLNYAAKHQIAILPIINYYTCLHLLLYGL